ncbi:MAG: WalW protein [Alphaproteobacteria bacterium]|nr:WalW protein [Alphaproteobacteria bacterium]
MLTLPKPAQAAKFSPGFAPASLLTVDTEEGFDWTGPFTRDKHDLTHLSGIPAFQALCEELGASPVYLVDWPIVQSSLAKDIIGDAVRRGTAEVGVQLHPWVNPPFDEEVNPRNSFAGNLSPELERAKFTTLRDAIEDAFGHAPIIYRAGRYGLGPATRALLQDTGVTVDSSVRALYDYSPGDGRDYSAFPNSPYWISSEPPLLELPLTTVYTGALARHGRSLFPRLARLPHAAGIAARTGLLERIGLTPEGTPLRAAIRAVDAALSQGLPLLVLSFHSPSLVPGNPPYVRTQADLDALLDWLREIYAHMATRDVTPTTVRGVWEAARRP